MSKETMKQARSWIQANKCHDHLCDIFDLDDHGNDFIEDARAALEAAHYIKDKQ